MKVQGTRTKGQGPSKKVGTQNETRENIMYNEETKAVVGAQFHCANASVSPATTPSRSIAALPQGFGKAGLFLATCLLYLAPAPAALAQNECGPGPTVECSDANYPDGITYDSSVDLSVTKTNSGTTTLDANGVTLTGTGSASVLWDSTVGRITGGDMTNGPVLDVLTDSGDIDIDSSGGSTSADTVTHGIRARSTAGGNVDVDVTDFISVEGADGLAAIEARSSGGNGNVVVSVSDIERSSGLTAIRGNTYGVLASAEGSGDLTIQGELQLNTPAGTRQIQLEGSTGAGIHATTGTGRLEITGILANSGSGSGAIIDAGGDVLFSGEVGGDQYGVDLLNVAAGTTSTIELTSTRFLAEDVLAMVRAQGEGTVIVNMAVVQFGDVLRPDHNFQTPNFDFTGLTQTAQVNVVNQAIWRVENTTVPDGNFDIYIRESGGLGIGEFVSGSLGDLRPFSSPFVVEFEGPDRLLVNEGSFVVGPENVQTEARIEGLAEFRHSGRILLGASNSGQDLFDEPWEGLGSGNRNGDNGGMVTNRTDAATDDVLAVPDVNWIGEGGEIWIDVDPSSGQSQASCERDAGTGSLPAADCLELHGATTSGVTYFVFVDPLAFDRGRHVPGQEIVLVDVAGGESAQGHFTVSPRQPGYSPLFGGSWDRGFFQYAIAYDEGAQAHSLVTMINGSAYQQARLASTAHDLWRTSTATSLDRQADLRERGEEENGGLWLRFSNETADRDIVDVEQAGGQDFPYDNSFSRDAYAVTFGLDFLSGGAGDSAWVFGAMGGYVNSDVDYNVSPNRAEINGWSLGGYAGFVAGPLWIDGAVNVNEATLRQHIPGLNLIPPDTKVSNDLRSVGAQVDAGWRIDLTDVFFVEPLASVSYVTTSFDTLNVKPDDASRPGLDLDWEDPTSLRAGLGGRVGTDYNLGFMRGQVSLSAKVWNESDGESVVSIHNNAFPDDPDTKVKDTFDDTVTEVSLGASVRSPGDAVSGFINLGGATASDYDTFTAKLGVRYQW